MKAVNPIMVYDGVCILCSTAIRFVLRHEIKAKADDERIHFVAIQSPIGQQIARAHGVDPEQPDTFLFIEDGTTHSKSDGILALLLHLSFPARLMRISKFVPRYLRDLAYDLLAKNRYRIFGREVSCDLPEAIHRQRFTLPET